MTEWIKTTKKNNVPNCPGCYVIYSRTNKIIYVGTSKNLFYRLSCHPFFKDGKNKYIKYKQYIDPEVRFSTERYFINHLKPKLNKAAGIYNPGHAFIDMSRDTANRLVTVLEDRPGLTASSVCRAIPGVSGGIIRKLIKELTVSGIIQPIPKGSHDGLRLVRK